VSGPALSKEAIEARRKAALDQELYELENGVAISEGARAARVAAVMHQVAPLNSRILQGRRAVQRRRQKAKRAAASRRRNRA
jgi:hypothetical protein